MKSTVSLSISLSSSMPTMWNSSFMSGSNLSSSKPLLGSQPTWLTCLKSEGAPMSALVSFFLSFSLLFFPFFSGTETDTPFLGAISMVAVGGDDIELLPGVGGKLLGLTGCADGCRLFSIFSRLRCALSCSLPSMAFLNLKASSSLAKFRPTTHSSASKLWKYSRGVL